MDKKQQERWEREYRSSQMLSPSNVPQADVVRFMRWLKKDHRKRGVPFEIDTKHVLDLGSGTGRNAYYLAEQGALVTGFEFSRTALAIAQKVAAHGDLKIKYLNHNIGTVYPITDSSIDIVLDVTSSNSLSDTARQIYLKEISRVMAPGAHFFLRALSLEKDANAKELIRRFPGPDPDTYIHPDLGIIEKVFSRNSFEKTYAPYFSIQKLERVEHYNRVAGRLYKRSYWIAYMQKL